MPSRARLAHRGQADARRRAVRRDDYVGVVHELLLDHALVLFDFGVLLHQLGYMLFEHVCLDVQRVDYAPRYAHILGPAGGRPGLGRQLARLVVGHLDRLHHLADHAVAHDDYRIAVLVSHATRAGSAPRPPVSTPARTPECDSRHGRRRGSPGSSRSAQAVSRAVRGRRAPCLL